LTLEECEALAVLPILKELAPSSAPASPAPRSAAGREALARGGASPQPHPALQRAAACDEADTPDTGLLLCRESAEEVLAVPAPPDEASLLLPWGTAGGGFLRLAPAAPGGGREPAGGQPSAASPSRIASGGLSGAPLRVVFRRQGWSEPPHLPPGAAAPPPEAARAEPRTLCMLAEQQSLRLVAPHLLPRPAAAARPGAECEALSLLLRAAGGPDGAGPSGARRGEGAASEEGGGGAGLDPQQLLLIERLLGPPAAPASGVAAPQLQRHCAVRRVGVGPGRRAPQAVKVDRQPRPRSAGEGASPGTLAAREAEAAAAVAASHALQDTAALDQRRC
jgi:hypothetical protein